MTTAPVDTEGIETVTVTRIGDEVEFMGKRGTPSLSSPSGKARRSGRFLFLSLSFVRERRDSSFARGRFFLN